MRIRTEAMEVREGDSLPGLSNGYVFEDAEPADNQVGWSGRYAAAMDEGLVLISFHDSTGDENYLILRSDFELEVERDA